MSQKAPYSFHYFMFPFRFDKIKERFENKYNYYQKYSFDERVKEHLKYLKDTLEKDGWEYKKFEVANSFDYNELAYFYDFTKEALFNTQEFQENGTSYFFEKDYERENKEYIITINQSKFKKEYKLKLASISLRVFDTGIAILTYEVVNFKYKDMKDILKINDFGRRIYPQFLGKEFNIQACKDSFLPDSIEIDGIRDDFNKNYQKTNHIQLPKFITELLGKNTFTTKKNELNKFFIQPVLDDRMFVICWYGNDAFSSQIKNIDLCNFDKNPKKEELHWIDKWYEYLFLDGNGKMVQNRYMQQELIKKSTYLRWKDYGTLYGISRYSFVCLTDRGYFNTNYILAHIKTIYFQLFTILLAQRASIIRFSDEITAVINEKKSKELASKVSTLYKNYLQFRSKLFFKELTAQEQGIELYQQAKEIMEIENHLNETDSEIKSLNEYAKLEVEKQENKEMKKLSKIATFFVPATFVAGVAGMNIFDDASIQINKFSNLGFWLVILLLGIALIWGYTEINKKDD